MTVPSPIVRLLTACAAAALVAHATPAAAAAQSAQPAQAAVQAPDAPPPGFRSLFNGRDLTGWRIPAGDGGHWRVVDGVIDYDAMSQAPGNKSLYTEEEFGDYELRIDWRLKAVPFLNPNVPIIMPDGTHKLDQEGNVIRMTVPDADSGILPRGHGKGQTNIWNWPTGSGEIYGYRMDASMPPEVRAAAVPKVNADNNIGEWNTFQITLRGDRKTVILNGQLVIDDAQLPEIPARGPIGLQHHGAMVDGRWTSAPSLIQFRNIYIRELN
jgi:hypothetical protein